MRGDEHAVDNEALERGLGACQHLKFRALDVCVKNIDLAQMFIYVARQSR